MASNTRPFDLKASSFSFPTLYLLTSDLDQVWGLLQQQVERAPEFFRNAPVIIDLSRLDEAEGEVDFPRLVGLMRGQGMLPVGLRGGDPEQQRAGAMMELALLGEGRSEERRPAQGARATEAAAAEPSAPPAAAAPARIVSRAVRSGQKIYAQGDLVVLAPVSPGAELMADGCIHVYGRLGGRALAGVKGERSARLFCHQFHAELVSVAGCYMISEDYPPQTAGRSVQVYLEGDQVRVEPLL